MHLQRSRLNMQKVNLTTELLSVLYYIRLTGHEENGRGKSILLHNKTQWLLYGFTLRFNSIYKCMMVHTHYMYNHNNNNY